MLLVVHCVVVLRNGCCGSKSTRAPGLLSPFSPFFVRKISIQTTVDSILSSLPEVTMQHCTHTTHTSSQSQAEVLVLQMFGDSKAVLVRVTGIIILTIPDHKYKVRFKVLLQLIHPLYLRPDWYIHIGPWFLSDYFVRKCKDRLSIHLNHLTFIIFSDTKSRVRYY